MEPFPAQLQGNGEKRAPAASTAHSVPFTEGRLSVLRRYLERIQGCFLKSPLLGGCSCHSCRGGDAGTYHMVSPEIATSPARTGGWSSPPHSEPEGLGARRGGLLCIAASVVFFSPPPFFFSAHFFLFIPSFLNFSFHPSSTISIPRASPAPSSLHEPVSMLLHWHSKC